MSAARTVRAEAFARGSRGTVSRVCGMLCPLQFLCFFCGFYRCPSCGFSRPALPRGPKDRTVIVRRTPGKPAFLSVPRLSEDLCAMLLPDSNVAAKPSGWHAGRTALSPLAERVRASTLPRSRSKPPGSRTACLTAQSAVSLCGDIRIPSPRRSRTGCLRDRHPLCILPILKRSERNLPSCSKPIPYRNMSPSSRRADL